MTNERFDALFGGPPRKPEDQLEQRHMDLAASLQTEEVVLRLTSSSAQKIGLTDLCLTDGVALNCVANGKIMRAGAFKRMWILPAAGDSGGALGAALAAHYLQMRHPRSAQPHDAMRGSYLGPEYSQSDIERRLSRAGARFETLSDDALFQQCSQALAEGKALGWFQGRMEFGPRVLGARSKDARDWFELDDDSPYMLLVADVVRNRRRQMTEEQRLFGIAKLNVPRSEVPAATQVDYSARIHTVHRNTNPRFHRLISEFKQRTGCPVLVNTSFNARDEPIVCTPEDAFRCFMGTEIEYLAVGNCLLRKEAQDPALRGEYHAAFEPD